MGTRHLILVYYKGQYLIAQYSQWDGYPERAGIELLNWLSDQSNLTKIKSAFDNNMIYTPTKAELTEWEKQCAGLSNTILDAVAHVVPSLSRSTGHKILSIVANAEGPVPIQTEVDFITDSLSCEWAYVVDLDNNMYEVHSHVYPKTPCQNERFKDFSRAPQFIQGFELGALPSQQVFLEQLHLPMAYKEEDWT
jgi:hypothetical protein